MSTLASIEGALQTAINKANTTTEGQDTNVTDAIDTLIAGYGSGGGGGGVGPKFELIGEWTGYLSEYTGTSTAEQTDTGINITNTTYAWIIIVTTCDGTYTNNNDWGGLAITIGGRYKSNGKYYNGQTDGQRRTQSLTLAGMVDSTQTYGTFGVFYNNNSDNLILCRKAHGSACPKLMAGNYTVKAYGIVSL